MVSFWICETYLDLQMRFLGFAEDPIPDHTCQPSLSFTSFAESQEVIRPPGDYQSPRLVHLGGADEDGYLLMEYKDIIRQARFTQRDLWQ